MKKISIFLLLIAPVLVMSLSGCEGKASSDPVKKQTEAPGDPESSSVLRDSGGVSSSQSSAGTADSSDPDDPQFSAGVTASDTALARIDGVTSATALPNHASFNGTLVIPPRNNATVTLTMGGIVHSTSLLSGEFVRKGTVIVTLENPDFIALQQTYLEALAQVEYLAAEYRRQERLSAEEAASQKRFQQSKADYLSMKSRLEAASAQLTILGIKPEEISTGGIRPYLEVKAPLSGYIVGLDINLGKYVNAGEPICDLIDKKETMLCLTAYEKDLTDLAVGNQVQFRVNGMGKRVFHGRVISIGQEIDPVNRSLSVYVQVKESDPQFRPGMYVSARIEKK